MLFTSNAASRRPYKLLAFALMALPPSICSTAFAARYWKNGVASGSWSNANNWSATAPYGTDNAGPPGSGDIAYIQSSGSSSFNVVLDESDAVAGLNIGATGTGTDYLNQNGNFNLSVSGQEDIGYQGSGEFTQNAGTDTVGTANDPQALYLGTGSLGSGTLNLSGTASLVVSGAVDVGGGTTTRGVFTPLGYGTLNVGAGATMVSNSLGIANSGYVNIGSGASVSVEEGIYDDGSLSSSGNLSVSSGAINIGYLGIGTLTQVAGAIGSSATIVALGTGLSPALAAGTYNLSGSASLTAGTLCIGTNGTVNAGGAGVFNQTGGTVSIDPGIPDSTCVYVPCVGGPSNSVGTLAVGGTASLTVNGNVLVGNYGTGAFAQSGGTVAISGYEQLYSGTLTQTGGTATIVGGIFTGGYTEGISQSHIQFSGGTLSIGAADINLNSALVVGNGSSVAVLNLSNAAGYLGYMFENGISVSQNATLSGGGSVFGGVTVAGTISPTASVATLGLTELTLQSTATTLIQRVGSTPAFGSINAGSISLAGVLAVYEDAVNEAQTTSSQSFIILQTIGSGVLSGAFSNIASGQVLTTVDGTASFLVTVNEGVDGDVLLSDFQPVPEPGMVGVIGALGMVAMRKRRKVRS